MAQTQRQQVTALERNGQDTTLARELLDTFEMALALHLSERGRLRTLLELEGSEIA